MMDRVSTVVRPRRREYSVEFKASVLEQCRQSGASIAGVALAQGINQNMVHRWIREERQRLELAELQRGAAAFLPVHLSQVPVVHPSPEPRVAPPIDPSDVGQGIRIEVQRAGGKVTVTWPVQSASDCGAWLREWLR
jgi:transposase-like protein